MPCEGGSILSLKVCSCGQGLVEGLCLQGSQGRSEDLEEEQGMAGVPAWLQLEQQEQGSPSL